MKPKQFQYHGESRSLRAGHWSIQCKERLRRVATQLLLIAGGSRSYKWNNNWLGEAGRGDLALTLVVKNMPANSRRCKRHQLDPWGRKIPCRKAATHSRIVSWRMPWAEEPGGLQSIGSQRVGHDWSDSRQHSTAGWELASEALAHLESKRKR